MKIYHAADIHLGRTRLDGRLPDEDLAAAFRYIARAAVEDKADVFLLAGDLFDRPQVEPRHLRQAQEVLQVLFEAEIPVIAIEGNHDKTFVHSNDTTWVGYLAEDKLLKLLRPQFGPEGAILTPWDPTAHRGSFVDVQGIRIMGAGYLGAATPAKVRQCLAAMNAPMPHVLLLHAGPEYFVGEGGGFSKEDLEALREKVVYLALGHIHKPTLYEGWACNPGSPENCDLREEVYSRAKGGQPAGRGYAVVEIDPSRPGKPLKIEIRSNPRRPIHRAELDCSPFGDMAKNGTTAMVEAAVQAIVRLKPEPTAMIDLHLTGKLKLGRMGLDVAQACLDIAKTAGVFGVALDPAELSFPTGEESGEDTPMLSRDELERKAIRDLVKEHSLWGLIEQQEGFVDLFYELKESVRLGRDPESIMAQIETSPLVEEIRKAQAVVTSRGLSPKPEAAASEVGI